MSRSYLEYSNYILKEIRLFLKEFRGIKNWNEEIEEAARERAEVLLGHIDNLFWNPPERWPEEF